MKYTLINCYSDNNKGDLGIILSTIDYLKKNDDDAIIKGVSTYNYSDSLYHTDHELLKKEINVFPSIFGELNIANNKSFPVKSLRFIWDTIRVLIFLISPVSLSSKLLFSKQEKQTLNKIIESDYIVSKGGSFICNEKDVRSKIALIRLSFIFLLSIKLEKKVVILNQSIGPVYGNLSIKLVNYILSKSYKVVLREKKCVENYQYLSFPKNTIISNDIAFYLQSEKIQSPFFNECINIGVTTKFVDKDKENDYQKMWVKSIEYILEKNKNANIIIFNQVPIDKDIESSWIIYKKIDDKYKNRIYIMSNNYKSANIKYLYGKMDYFIGTRLHSTIFAIGESVPSICISYHGTKAEGIFENMGFSEFVVHEYSADVLIEKFNKLVSSRDYYTDLLSHKLLEYQTRMNKDFTIIFNDN